MHFALGLDHDLSEFHAAFKRDPLIGPVIRRRPWLRPRRRPEPFEALAWAICEQLIDGERAVGIQRRLIHRFGRRSEPAGLRDAPSPQRLAGRAPAEIESCGLAAKRAIALRRAAHEVAQGRADLHARPGAAPGAGCGRSPTSAPGRSSAWRSTATAATTCCPPSTWPT